MSCAHCVATDKKFTSKIAERDRQRYRNKGPNDTTRAILHGLEALPLDGMTHVDVGGGIGVLVHELLSRGVATAVLVDAASSYLAAARVESEARGTESRVRFVPGDFVEVAHDVSPADIVTLDRVICCYPDFRQLLAHSQAKSREAYAISYPRDRWSVRIMFALQNLGSWLLRDAFRIFVHPPTEIERELTGSGLELASRVRTFVWTVDVYRRLQPKVDVRPPAVASVPGER